MPREPWIKLKIGIRRSGKIAALPSDSARLGWIYALVEAKVQRSLGVFDNQAHFVEVLGRFGKFFDAYRDAGLIHVAPDLCTDCKPRHRDARRGHIVIHDYRREQRDPTNADRQAAYREAHADEDESVDEPVDNGDRNALRNADRNADSNGQPGATVTGDSRARATTATGTTTERTESGSPDVGYPAPRAQGTRKTNGFDQVGDVAASLADRSAGWTQALTLAERDEWSSFGSEWDTFRAVWLERGFRHPPAGSADDDPNDEHPSQRALLHSVLDAWPTDLPRWISDAPKRLSAAGVVAHVIDRWHAKRDEGNERADAQEVDAATLKAWGS